MYKFSKAFDTISPKYLGPLLVPTSHESKLQRREAK
ncbi:unknown protein [Arabidopsis thaliana]|uniref:Uncharacterized protein n=4 Tax=Arabidopsis TaxID=3701 RepID=A0A654F9H9_ARATH|nr:uncharacterized protein AT3G05080 [Arabidopsis thaliana]KAG7624089.1 hypothetical protein ISN45_At03g004730 [Arabidopsis thaliana x Arabidopsis arenosa]KAG7630088.1 hypothetical protein ISN44_As03g004680 [Arabidopsis suecica]AAF27014.1 unknown protein [Arabidopsis thaliana]ABF47117.1 At3g05080 [Arabidopsis thaliana]AEE74185.1 hypothetical protein AT3G05080 [Arabidopsis thaliana]|eukprot:NP_187159.1 hypothetical protein AT3G05080 [Arabidopsis thaliana]